MDQHYIFITIYIFYIKKKISNLRVKMLVNNFIIVIAAS